MVAIWVPMRLKRWRFPANAGCSYYHDGRTCIHSFRWVLQALKIPVKWLSQLKVPKLSQVTRDRWGKSMGSWLPASIQDILLAASWDSHWSILLLSGPTGRASCQSDRFPYPGPSHGQGLPLSWLLTRLKRPVERKNITKQVSKGLVGAIIKESGGRSVSECDLTVNELKKSYKRLWFKASQVCIIHPYKNILSRSFGIRRTSMLVDNIDIKPIFTAGQEKLLHEGHWAVKYLSTRGVELDLSIVSNEEIKRLTETTVVWNKPTDVLSDWSIQWV